MLPVTKEMWFDAEGNPTTEDKAIFGEIWTTMPDGSEGRAYLDMRLKSPDGEDASESRTAELP